MLIADAGFSAYQNTIATSRKLATGKNDLVQRFVDASLEGWAQYLQGGPAIRAANALIKQQNPDQDRRAHRLRHQGSERARHRSFRRRAHGGVGAMSDARWKDFYHDSMTDVDVVPKGLDVRQAYTLEFVGKGIGGKAGGRDGRNVQGDGSEQGMLRDLVKKFVRNPS